MGSENSKLQRVNEEGQTQNTRVDGHNAKETSMSANTSNQEIHVHGNTEAQIVAPFNILGNKNTISINSPTTSKPQQKRLEFNIHESVPSFFGRDDFIRQMHADINQNQMDNTSSIRSKALIICGMAGVGKTQTVRKYIEKYKKSYDHVLWINSETYSEAIRCFIQLAKEIQLEVTHNGKQIAAEEIVDKIYNIICNAKFSLIVFDNVGSFKTDDGNEGLHLLLPKSVKSEWKVPAIIVTTRTRDWSYFKLRELGGFDLNESMHFLAALEFEDNDDNRRLVEEVVKLCQGLPLALQQVISFVRNKIRIRACLDEEKYTLNDFLSDVSLNKKEFVSTKPPESASLDVFSIFQMAFDQIDNMTNGTLALQCLDIMSILNPDNIPTVLIKQFLQQAELGEALSLLHNNNLITRCDSFYQIHRMIQEVVIESRNIKDTKFQFVKTSFNDIVNSTLTFLQEKEINYNLKHVILTNAVRIHNYESEPQSEQFLEFQNVLASTLCEVGSYRAAIQIYERAVQTSKNVWGSDHIKTIQTNINRGENLRRQGKYDQAKHIFNTVQKQSQNVLGADHPEILCRTKHNLALVFDSQGKYEAAQELYEEVLKIRIITLGGDHPETLRTKHNLAIVFHQQGKYEAAQELYNEVLKILINTLGADHPDTLRTKHNLAGVFHKQGKYEAGQELYKEVLKIRINTLGADHPETLTTKHNLAGVFHRKGKYEVAQQLYKEVLKIRINTLGADHPETLTTKHNLAVVSEKLGKRETAQELYNEVLKIQTNVIGADHPDTLTTKRNLQSLSRNNCCIF